MKRITITIDSENEEFLNLWKVSFLTKKNQDVSYTWMVNELMKRGRKNLQL